MLFIVHSYIFHEFVNFFFLLLRIRVGTFEVVEYLKVFLGSEQFKKNIMLGTNAHKLANLIKVFERIHSEHRGFSCRWRVETS